MFLNIFLVDCLQGFAYGQAEKLVGYEQEERVKVEEENERYRSTPVKGQERGQWLWLFLSNIKNNKSSVLIRYFNATN